MISMTKVIEKSTIKFSMFSTKRKWWFVACLNKWFCRQMLMLHVIRFNKMKEEKKNSLKNTILSIASACTANINESQ